MGYDIAPRQCEHCGGGFVPNGNGQRFCTAGCRRNAAWHGRPRYESRPCAQCGSEFTPKANFSTCCSGKCYSAQWLTVPENRESQREGNKRRYREDPNYRTMQLEYQARLRSDPERRIRNAEYLKRRSADPENMEKRRAYDRDRYANNTEARRKRLGSQKRRRAKLKERDAHAA